MCNGLTALQLVTQSTTKWSTSYQALGGQHLLLSATVPAKEGSAEFESLSYAEVLLSREEGFSLYERVFKVSMTEISFRMDGLL